MPISASADDLSRMIHGAWTAQAVYVAAKLGIADLLADGPRSAEQLAEATGVLSPTLFRVLRALAGCGVFALADDGRFSLTPLAEPLRSDAPHSQRFTAIMLGEEQYQAYGELLYCVRTGRPAFDKLFGQPIFDYLASHPEQARVFDAAMSGIHGRETAAIAAAYDFSPFGTLADIGGGNGSTLFGILERFPLLRGVLFDLPGVIERTRPRRTAAGLESRCELVSGNFFESVPAGADAYFLRHIIHDWDDERALAILRQIHRVMPLRGKLLVAESVIPSGNEPCFGKLLDLTMLVIPGGQERTESEYRDLFHAARFELTRVQPTTCEVSILEATPVRV